MNNTTGILVKYHSMIQNIYENQLYLSYFHDNGLNKNVVNKYYEHDYKSLQSKVLKL